MFTFVFHPGPSAQHRGGLMHFGAKLKIDYLVLNVKLLLDNTRKSLTPNSSMMGRPNQ